MKFVCLALCLVLVAQSQATNEELKQKWNDFKLKHKKTYASEDEAGFRFKIFANNLMEVVRHNREYDEGKHTYKKGINQFSDLLHSEFLEKMTVDLREKTERQRNIVELKGGEAPEAIDWREKGAVTPVKDQGGCGSCWAFSTTGTLEGQHFLKTGKMVSLSEQQLVDCTRDSGNYGCGGGWPYIALDYINKNKGDDTEESYPYEGRDGQCRFNPDTVGATDTGYVDLPASDEEALKEAVGTIGPISVLINADGFFSYSSGILNVPNCDPNYLNHAVLAAGYGSENGQDYWLVKNSWGPSWGEEGYLRVARNANNMCGIASQSVYPTV